MSHNTLLGWAGNKTAAPLHLGRPVYRLIWLYFRPYGFISAAMIPDLQQLLFDRLQKQGVNTNEAPALLRDLSKILESNPEIDPAAANSKLHPGLCSLPGRNWEDRDSRRVLSGVAWFGHRKECA